MCQNIFLIFFCHGFRYAPPVGTYIFSLTGKSSVILFLSGFAKGLNSQNDIYLTFDTDSTIYLI